MKLTLSHLLLRITKMILMLLAYKVKWNFFQNLQKVQIFHPYIIDAFRLLPVSSHLIIARFSNFWGWFLYLRPQMAFLSHFFWLLLNRSHKTCPALQCVWMIFQIFSAKLSRKLLTLIIIISNIFMVYFFTVDKKCCT